MDFKNLKKATLLLIVCVSCKNQTENANTPINLYDLAINTYETKYLKDDGLPKMSYVSDETINDTIELKTVFSRTDIVEYSKFKVNQIKLSAADVKSKKLISDKSIKEWSQLGYDGFWEKFEKEYNNSGFYKISQPIYSQDKERVLILLDVTYFKLNTTTFYMIFRNEKGTWKLELINSL